MIDKIISAGVALLVAAALVWFFNGKIRDYYQRPLIEAQEKADAKQVKREADNIALATKAKDDKIKALEKNVATTTRVAAGAVGLRDAADRASERARVNHDACVQHSNSLGQLFFSARDFADRVAKDADGHVADKIELRDAWPK